MQTGRLVENINATFRLDFEAICSHTFDIVLFLSKVRVMEHHEMSLQFSKMRERIEDSKAEKKA